MACAVAGLAIPGKTVIQEIFCIAKSSPNFKQIMTSAPHISNDNTANYEIKKLTI